MYSNVTFISAYIDRPILLDYGTEYVLLMAAKALLRIPDIRSHAIFDRAGRSCSHHSCE